MAIMVSERPAKKAKTSTVLVVTVLGTSTNDLTLILDLWKKTLCESVVNTYLVRINSTLQKK
jgi:hypothetical protein